MRAYVAFAGGGAKGIVHVGALRALEDLRSQNEEGHEAESVEIVGAAGTSAGAIVAALCAAGYRGDEIVSLDASRTILHDLADIDPAFHSATALFGPGGWLRIAVLRELTEGLDASRTIGGAFLWVGLGSALALAHPSIWAEVLLAWVLASVLLWGLLAAYIIRGLAHMRSFRDALNELLRRKLNLPKDEVVRFRHFGGERRTLKIVASDLSGRAMRLFSPERTGSASVADAVAASACLPIAFAPWQFDQNAVEAGGDHDPEDAFENKVFVDGGLVSNLPAWPFDEERELDLHALTIAFDIRAPARRPRPGVLTWPSAAVETALSGAGELNTRAVQRGEMFTLESEVDLLAFDMRPADLKAQVDQATVAARIALLKRIFADPGIYRDACSAALKLVVDSFHGQPDNFSNSAVGRVRAAVALRSPRFRQSLRLQYAAGYEAGEELGALLPIRGSVMGAALASGKIWLERVPFASELALSDPRYEALRARFWPDMRWCLCIPIFEPGADKAAFVVAIDGAGDLRDGEAVDAFVNAIAIEVQDMFNDVVLKLALKEE